MPINIKSQNTVSVGIGDIHSLFTVNGYASWMCKLIFSVPTFAELKDKMPFWVELLNSVVKLVCHIDISIPVKGDVARIVELTLSAITFPMYTEFEQQVPFDIKLLNTVVVSIHHP